MDDEEPSMVYRMWRMGFDTVEIARHLKKPEARIERMLHLALEQRGRRKPMEKGGWSDDGRSN